MVAEMTGMLVPAVILVAMAFSLPSARADGFLSSLDGRWSGSGWAKRNSGSPREVVRCRIKNTYVDASQRLVVTGKCVVPGRKFDLSGTVSARDGSNEINGRWSNPFGMGSTRVNGRRSGDQIRFTFSAKDPETKMLVDQAMKWIRSGEGFSITTLNQEENGEALSKIEFRR